MANGMLLHLGMRHRGMVHGPPMVDHSIVHGPLLVDHSIVHGPLLVDYSTVHGPLLSADSFSRWHHRRTMVPLGPNRANKNTEQ